MSNNQISYKVKKRVCKQNYFKKSVTFCQISKLKVYKLTDFGDFQSLEVRKK
jgi:hypothetical protein